jgi:hypothetical protein
MADVELWVRDPGAVNQALRYSFFLSQTHCLTPTK